MFYLNAFLGYIKNKCYFYDILLHTIFTCVLSVQILGLEHYY